jgi:mandelamide amidase
MNARFCFRVAAFVAVLASTWTSSTQAQPATGPAANHIASLSAVEALEAMETGSLTSEQYVDVLIERIFLQEELNAVISIDPEQVRAAARAADAMRASGAVLGPLHGLPILVKDSINTAALPTTGGTPALADFQPTANAPALQSLFNAGAFLLGKTNLHELSAGITTNNAFTGPTRNPYDLTRIPGGSSGGNGAALAAGLAPVALGEDTGGSIRIPAALNGVAGFRPTTGRYSQSGVVPIAPTVDTVGPMARTVEDIALLDSVMTGTAVGLAEVNLEGLRLGVPHAYFRELLDPRVENELQKVFNRLSEAGVELVEADIPLVGEDTSQAFFAVLLFEAPTALGDYLRANNTGITVKQLAAQVASPDVKFLLDLALSGPVSKKDYKTIRDGLIPLLQSIHSDYLTANDLDAVLMPTNPLPAPLIGEEVVTIDGVEMSVFDAFNLTHYAAFVGAAALSIPMGQLPDGLPVGGIDVVGALGDDRQILAIGAAIARELPPIRAPHDPGLGSAAVPEPCTLMLLALSLSLVAGRRRRTQTIRF